MISLNFVVCILFPKTGDRSTSITASQCGCRFIFSISTSCSIHLSRISFTVLKCWRAVCLCQDVQSLPCMLKQHFAAGCGCLGVPATDYRDLSADGGSKCGSPDRPKCDKFISEGCEPGSCILVHVLIQHRIWRYFCRRWVAWLCVGLYLDVSYMCLSHVRLLLWCCD